MSAGFVVRFCSERGHFSFSFHSYILVFEPLYLRRTLWCWGQPGDRLGVGFGNETAFLIEKETERIAMQIVVLLSVS